MDTLKCLMECQILPPSLGYKLPVLKPSSIFLGQYCTEKDCSTFDWCQNGGTCYKVGGGIHCQCVNGWTGDDCSENFDDCRDAACSQGSTCHDRVASFFCECPPGRTGEHQCVFHMDIAIGTVTKNCLINSPMSAFLPKQLQYADNYITLLCCLLVCFHRPVVSFGGCLCRQSMSQRFQL